MNNNVNRKIDRIAVTKTEKDDDWEIIHIFMIEKIIEVSNEDDSKQWKNINKGKFIKQEDKNVRQPYITRAKAQITKKSNKNDNIKDNIIELIDVTHD